jgi:phospholipid-translocating ATPase
MVWTIALFWYSLYNDFDGSYLFDYTYIVLVNVAFTSLPVILMGIFDQDVDDKVSLAVPQLYMRGIERKEWSQTKFWYLSLVPGVPALTDITQAVYARWLLPVGHMFLHAIPPF